MDDQGWGVFGYRRAHDENEFFEEGSPRNSLIKPLFEYRLSPDLIYGSTAVKCLPPLNYDKDYDVSQKDLIKVKHIKKCLQVHLGPELEAVQPYVIWVTGNIGCSSVAYHFRDRSITDMEQGDIKKINAPEIWRNEEILVVRSAHPKDFILCEEIENIVRIVKTYVTHEIDFAKKTPENV